MAHRSKSEIKAVSESVQQRLERLIAAGEPILPMPHKIERGQRGGQSTKLSLPEWNEWCQRRALQRMADPQYDSRFVRPSEKTTLSVWELLREFGFQGVKSPAAYTTLIREDVHIAERRLAGQQALVIVLDTFLTACEGNGQISYRRVFDALCRGFSDHFLSNIGKVSSVRNMRPETVAMCRRDLRLMGVVPKDHWNAIVNWITNPLFLVGIHDTGERSFTKVRFAEDGESARERYRSVIASDDNYRPARPSGIKVRFVKEGKNSKPNDRSNLKTDNEDGDTENLQAEVCAERPYNVVELGDASKDLLSRLAAVTLYFNVSHFNRDYEAARAKEADIRRRLDEEYGIDATLPDAPRRWREGGREQERWSERAERIYYRSIEVGIERNLNERLDPTELRNYEKLIKFRRHLRVIDDWCNPVTGCIGPQVWMRDLYERFLMQQWRERVEQRFRDQLVTPEVALFEVDKAMVQWRADVRGYLEEFDAARVHQRVFKHVYAKVKGLSGYTKIESDFRRLITRRYQPRHFWPTYVTSKSRTEWEDGNREGGAATERVEESYRRRWFRGDDPLTGEPCELAGFDISASQMQIIAAFLGDEGLQNVTMTKPEEPSFKQAMAKWAWEMHEAGQLELRGGSKAIKPYEGASDERLQELVKELLMRVSYGSRWPIVEMDQHLHPVTYGPGWASGNAGIFMKAFNERYPGPAKFREICKAAARASFARDPGSGICLVDPFDGKDVRWNPVARDHEYRVDTDGDGLRISVPRGLPIRSKRIRNETTASVEFNASQEPDAGKTEEGYPVDPDELERMASPCLVHMLDAYYSSLVMKGLVDNGVRCFVGIHDCWLVPATQTEILRQQMERAARDWFLGLERVYLALLRHFDEDAKEKEHEELLRAYETWKTRTSSDTWDLRFRAKPVR